jgi:KaiB domain
VLEGSWTNGGDSFDPAIFPPWPIDPDQIDRLCVEERRYRMGPPPPVWFADDTMRERSEPLVLLLYVSANSPACAKAIQTLSNLLRNLPPQYAQLSIVDVALNIDAAARDRVIFTPTLMCGSGLPRVRVIGDLSNREVLVELLQSAGLDLDGH